MAKLVKLTTPKGVTEPYAWLKKADTKFNDRGERKVSLTCPLNSAAKKLIKQLEQIHEEAYAEHVEEYEKNPPKVAKGKKPLKPYEGDMPWFIDEEENTVTFNFKSFASYLDKKTDELVAINLKCVDSKGQYMKEIPNIGTGSTLKIKFTALPYKWNAATGASLKLQLDSIMVVELVEFSSGGGSSSEWADELEEDGYVRGQADDDWSGDEDDEPEDEDEPKGGDF